MPIVCGQVAPGFEEVRYEFERGGHRTPEGDAPWNEDTMVVVMSSTKGLSAMTLAVANARGWLDYEAPFARFWPEFAQNSKEAITVRQLLGHEAGLVLLDEELPITKMRDLDAVARLLARSLGCIRLSANRSVRVVAPPPEAPPSTSSRLHERSLPRYNFLFAETRHPPSFRRTTLVPADVHRL